MKQVPALARVETGSHSDRAVGRLIAVRCKISRRFATSAWSWMSLDQELDSVDKRNITSEWQRVIQDEAISARLNVHVAGRLMVSWL